MTATEVAEHIAEPQPQPQGSWRIGPDGAEFPRRQQVAALREARGHEAA